MTQLYFNIMGQSLRTFNQGGEFGLVVVDHGPSFGFPFFKNQILQIPTLHGGETLS